MLLGSPYAAYRVTMGVAGCHHLGGSVVDCEGVPALSGDIEDTTEWPWAASGATSTIGCRPATTEHHREEKPQVPVQLDHVRS